MNIEQNIMQIPIDDIIPNRFQPRLNFDDRGLDELSDSIKQHGIIQPLVLRRVGDKYEIIAGERRYKAATQAGLTEVPAVIANVDDNKSAEVAIVENVQRRDLSAIEEARSYKNLLDKGYLTQKELAKKMGLSQSAIANKLRLLNLDEDVQRALLNNQISERHARSLLVLPTHEEQKEWLNKIINNRLTVRQLDDAIKKIVKNTYSEEEIDIPLVKPLDIEAIRKEATELPRINEESDIARKLKEIEREKMYNPDVIPVEQASNDSKSNFFNFLENETVNMNMEETNLQTPIIDLEIPKISQTEEHKKNNEQPQPESNHVHNFGQIANTISYNPNSDIFDPVDLIETLDPTYEEKIEEKLGLDLKTVINEIRNTKNRLTEKGFNISLEETDLNDKYQFIIKIDKN